MNLERTVALPIASASLTGALAVPPSARGLVVLVGVGPDVESDRVARALAGELIDRGGVATLRFDLLAPSEAAAEREPAWLREHVPTLAQRLSSATDWVMLDAEIRQLRVGYYAAGEGAAAALHAATSRPDVRAIVARGGRPDLAGAALEQVRAPTLLLVGEEDDALLAANRSARARLRASSELAIVRDARRGPDVAAALDESTRRASAWFDRYIR